jgi:RND family efflux transporter MFP subunit
VRPIASPAPSEAYERHTHGGIGWPGSVKVRLAAALGLLALLVTSGCGGDAAGRGGPDRGGQAMPVQTATLEPVMVSATSTYVGSIQSLESTVVSPQVGGILQSILVRSGDRVRAGQVLMQINPALQEAQVANLVNSRAALASTVSFDQVQLRRANLLYEEKIGTQQDFQSAQATYDAAQEQLKSLDAQIQQARVTLGYYRVTAPRAGIVGDIPVRVGDQVTTSTELTTLDTGSGLEVYAQVSIADSARLRVGLPLAVLDAQGDLISNTHVSFVSPQVDTQTQTILIKAPITHPLQVVRTLEYVQARMTWDSHRALQVPVLSVVQQGGSAFVYTLVPRGNGFYAHEVPVTLGPIQGNDYEVIAGLTAGQKVIVSTTQMLAEGEPVQPLPPAAAGQPGSAQGARR